MGITGYNIYRYTDKGDSSLQFDIVIFDSDSPAYTEGRTNYKIPNTLKIPLGAMFVGATFNQYCENSGTSAHLKFNVQSSQIYWTYDGATEAMVGTVQPTTLGRYTNNGICLYPVILHYDNKYYLAPEASISYYNYPPYDTGAPKEGIPYNYYERLSNADNSSTPKYPWFVPDATARIRTGGSYSIENYQVLSPNYTSFSTKDVTGFITKILGDSKPITPPDKDDPYDNGGNSKPGGGGGDGTIGGDTNPDDGLPTISALDSGLLTAYNPTVGELQNLGKFLWSDSFDVNTFKKLFNDPFDTLLGLSIIPISPNTSGSKNIMFGNLDSGVSAPVVANQWVTKDMGSVTLKEVWKGALDYAPSTSASIYLPFIGMRQLNINDVMGSTLHLIYKFDVLTGGCIAQIYINHNALGNKDDGFSWTENQGLVYEFMGQCSVNIPLASQDFTNTIRSAVSAVGMVAGASASIATGNPVLGIATATVASANLGMQANTPTVERSGHLSGSCAILGYSQPFLVVTRPHQCKPSRYYALRGVPSQVYTSKLSNCTGYTQITANNNIHCSGAQDSELQEIQNLLVSGVYFPDKKR